MAATQETQQMNPVELTTFYVGNALCGLDILKVQEINKITDMTRVPQAPEYVLGILNLRGQIVTVIDLGKKLGLGNTEVSGNLRNVIVNSSGASIGLLVREIGDVVEIQDEDMDHPPANMSGIQGEYFKGVFQARDNLIGILDLGRVLELDE